MIHLVTFATDDMSRARNLCATSAVQHGVDFAVPLDRIAVERSEAFQEHPQLFQQPRGFGYWAWKPALIERHLRLVCDESNEGDVIVYADSGVEFINNVNYIIDRMDQDIFLFGNNWEHAHWCKRDIIEAVWPYWERGRLLRGADASMMADRTVNVYVGSETERRDVNLRELAWESFGKQVQASVIFFRVSDYTRKFVKEWLDWCLFEGGRLIDDSPSRTPNHPEFQENRHDQAILTTMAYREGIRLHYWPAVYLPDDRVYEKLDCYGTDDYPPLFRHHRRRNHEWENAA